MVLKFDDINKNFDDVEVLKDLFFDVKKNEIVCIVGPSGCGKSTILNLIFGLLKPSSGSLFNGSDKVSYVLQEDRLLPWKTVKENIEIVNDSSNIIDSLIENVGLNGFENYYPSQLSGGMRQRCSIARAFNYETELLLMDEPFKSLDYTMRLEMVSYLLNIWNRKRKTVIFVTHEIDEALMLGDKILLLSNRPTKVVKEFFISKKKEERCLTEQNLVDIRNEIIDLMYCQNNS